MTLKILFLQIFQIFQLILAESERFSELSNYIQPLRENLFQNCDLIFIHDGQNFKNLENLIQNLYSLHNDQYFSIYFGYLYFQDLEYNSWISPHKFSPNHCSLVLLTIFKFNHLISDLIFQKLSPNLGAISRKDEDKFIFITYHNLVDQILLLKISRKIKFKLALGLSSSSKIQSLKTVCFYCNFGQFEIVNIPLFSDYSKLFPDFVKNFNGHCLRLSSPTRLTLAIEIEDFPNGNQKVWRPKRGHQVSMLFETQKRLNFTYIVFPSSQGGGTGMELKNGSWTGSVGDLIYDRCDIALITGQIYARSFVIGFNVPFTFVRLTFIVGRPLATFSWKSIWWAFTWEVWAFIIVFLLAVSAVICIFTKIKNTTNGIVIEVFLYVFGSLLEQSQRIQDKKISTRIIVIFWLCLGVILATGYRSKLLILLAFPIAESPPSDFPELVDSDFSWALEGAGVGGAVYDNIRSSNNPTYQKLLKKMTFEPDPVNCLLNSFKSKFACLAYREQLRYIFYRNFSSRSRKSPFIVSDSSTFFCSTGWAVEKRAIIAKPFDRIILMMLDTGVVNFWRESDYEKVRNDRLKWEKTPLIPDEHEGPSKLNMANFRGAFNIQILGLILSFFIFIVEKCHYNVKSFKKSLKIC